MPLRDPERLEVCDQTHFLHPVIPPVHHYSVTHIADDDPVDPVNNLLQETLVEVDNMLPPAWSWKQCAATAMSIMALMSESTLISPV